MAAKLLISGEANSGKTSLTKDLKDALVISHDGKKYPYKIPHVNVPELDSTEDLITIVYEKAEAYKERFGSAPETIVFDSISRVFESLYDACNKKYTGFAIYSNLDKQVKALTDFVENDLIANGVNVIMISHALWDADIAKYNLVGKGSFSKLGGFLSTVDDGIFIEAKNNKRVLHFRSTKFPARTLIEDLPDSLDVKDFDLTTHLQKLVDNSTAADEFEL